MRMRRERQPTLVGERGGQIESGVECLHLSPAAGSEACAPA